MPTYEYLCSSCGQRIEIIHPIHGGPPEACPNCGAVGTLRKSFAPPTIVFKGTGWAKKERAAARSSGTESADHGDGGDRKEAAGAGASGSSSTGSGTGSAGSGSAGSGSGSGAKGSDAGSGSSASRGSTGSSTAD